MNRCNKAGERFKSGKMPLSTHDNSGNVLHFPGCLDSAGSYINFMLQIKGLMGGLQIVIIPRRFIHILAVELLSLSFCISAGIIWNNLNRGKLYV